MNIEECYEKMNGNYADVSTRLPSLKMIERFISSFLEDKSYESLCVQMQSGNREEAFRSAHTLKGICANLGFSGLLKSTEKLTEELRAEIDTVSEKAAALFSDVKRDYEMTAGAIRGYLNESE
ncbi:MAG: Hpt domain-containing protein [Clostridiales bacterium]|nr:Hpt domain-containing protein [Clostridiales bacterium]